ncbi:hypothetical protein GLE_4733 [Lysobacter enzymogenes]|uniref:Uncharacterized protein n=1 Tax=Lysobacter enzymogenes TaxID=69 RepID=A0A0S2DNB5_LYSEN|nr:hypothetical protein GLE_4733 [Lysobacter enzymogenes]
MNIAARVRAPRRSRQRIAETAAAPPRFSAAPARASPAANAMFAPSRRRRCPSLRRRMRLRRHRPGLAARPGPDR